MQWDVFALGWHHHPNWDTEDCHIRSAVFVTLAGFTLFIGKFRIYGR